MTHAGPPRELVQVVADARDLPGAFALDGPCGRGPCPRLRHRPPQQLGRRHARCSRLLLPGCVLRRGDAGGEHHGAALRHRRTTGGVRGAASRARPLTSQRRGKPGVLGGRSDPLARPQCSTLRRLASASQTDSPAPQRTPLAASGATAPDFPRGCSSSREVQAVSSTATGEDPRPAPCSQRLGHLPGAGGVRRHPATVLAPLPRGPGAERRDPVPVR